MVPLNVEGGMWNKNADIISVLREFYELSPKCIF